MLLNLSPHCHVKNVVCHRGGWCTVWWLSVGSSAAYSRQRCGLSLFLHCPPLCGEDDGEEWWRCGQESWLPMLSVLLSTAASHGLLTAANGCEPHQKKPLDESFCPLENDFAPFVWCKTAFKNLKLFQQAKRHSQELISHWSIADWRTAIQTVAFQTE